MTPRLSICIPTADRASVLDAVLASLASATAGLPVEVCVADNASSDDSAAVLVRWQGRIAGLRVLRQPQRVDYATNVSAAVGLATAGYVWLLPNYAHVQAEVLGQILGRLDDASVDAVFLNVAGRIPLPDDRRFDSAQEAFRLLGWHTTLLGSFILRCEAFREVAARFAGSDFIHFEACFTDLAARPAPQHIVWLARDAWRPDPAKRIAWGERALTIWMSHWRSACLSLPAVYPLADRLHTLREHHRRSGVFDVRTLCSFRQRGGCSLRELLSLRDCWEDTGAVRVLRVALVGLLPVFLIAWLQILRKLRT